MPKGTDHVRRGRVYGAAVADVANLFPGAADKAYFNTASMALGNVRAAAALDTAVNEWLEGTFDWTAAEASGEELRALVASLLRVRPDDVAFVTGASGGASTVAAQLPHGATGANIVVPERDFASNFVPWQLLVDRGYELRLVSEDDGVLSVEEFSRSVDQQTAVVATSLVQSTTGFRVDLDALKELAHDHDAWLVIDASQALGSLPIDIDGIDALYSCSHKWLCGIRGMGYLYVHPDLIDRFRPITPGWKAADVPAASFYGPSIELSARASKLDVSTPWFDPIVNLEGARIIADAGIEQISTHASSLFDRLQDHGVRLAFDAANRSSIITVDVADPDATMARFQAENIAASVRAGKVRVSVHLYNTTGDIDLLAAAIA